MALYLIRHGQTDYNVARRFQGRIDIPLNETGRQQALQLSNYLRSKQVVLHAVYSSPLSRALETAQVIAAQSGEVLVEPDLIELDIGEFDGREEKAIATEMGADNYNQWRNTHFTTPAPGGESMKQAVKRVRSVTEKIAMQAGQLNVGIVAHQLILMAIKSVLTGRLDISSLQKFKQANDEIDVWDTEKSKQIQCLQFS